MGDPTVIAAESHQQLYDTAMAAEKDAIKLTDIQTKRCRDAFRSYDKGDGLKVGNISDAFKKMQQQVTPEFLERHEAEIDENGTGFISLEEFEQLLKIKLQEEADEKDLREVFRVLDKHKKGEIETDLIRWMFQELDPNLGTDEIEDMIADVDTDGSGWVDFEEFSKLMGTE